MLCDGHQVNVHTKPLPWGRIIAWLVLSAFLGYWFFR